MDRNYARYHQVLNRADSARILLMLLRSVDLRIDETLERRRGPKIKSLGMYRDAVRSSRSHLVKASGLRWISLMWLGHVPWAGRYWALPFLTVLAPSARYYRQRGRRHKKLTDWARQMVLQLRRWLPQRSLVLVGDGGYAVQLHCCQSLAQPVISSPACAWTPPFMNRPHPVTPLKGPAALKAGLRVMGLMPGALPHGKTVHCWQTAVWYRSGKPPVPIRWVLVRDPQGESPHRLCADRRRRFNGPSRKSAHLGWRPNARTSPAPRQS